MKSIIRFTVMVAFLMVLTGCAATRYEVAETPLNEVPVETVRIYFKRPFVAGTPAHDPVTVEEHIRCAHFYFEQARFEEAAEEFDRARQRIREPQNALYRACLISSAVCHLLTDNRDSFVKTIQELQSTFNRYELVVIEKRDERLKALFELYKEFLRTGTFGGEQ